jgi:hypothetical protein
MSFLAEEREEVFIEEVNGQWEEWAPTRKAVIQIISMVRRIGLVKRAPGYSIGGF